MKLDRSDRHRMSMKAKKLLTLGKILLAVAAVVLLLLLGRRVSGYLPQFVGWVDGLGVWGPLVFIAGYALAAVAFVPGSIMTL
ncbi:MAG: hypothetical protein DMH00_10940, partial [Acidobacteria bacterium]